MSRYSYAKWMPIPENSTQSRIKPTQFILHSVAAPWDENRIKQFWNESGVNTESHFGLDYDGSMGQYLDTNVRADANVSANYRAISIETASNVTATNKWTAAQVRELADLMAWAHRTHGIPARICRTSTDPGFGVHNMFPDWSGGGTACPGKLRTPQFRSEVFPLFRKAIGDAPVVLPRPVVRVADVQPDDRNDSVRIVQTALINKGFSIPSGPTGYFGNETQAAYIKFEKSLKIKSSDALGVPTRTTLTKLLPSFLIK